MRKTKIVPHDQSLVYVCARANMCVFNAERTVKESTPKEIEIYTARRYTVSTEASLGIYLVFFPLCSLVIRCDQEIWRGRGFAWSSEGYLAQLKLFTLLWFVDPESNEV